MWPRKHQRRGSRGDNDGGDEGNVDIDEDSSDSDFDETDVSELFEESDENPGDANFIF